MPFLYTGQERETPPRGEDGGLGVACHAEARAIHPQHRPEAFTLLVICRKTIFPGQKYYFRRTSVGIDSENSSMSMRPLLSGSTIIAMRAAVSSDKTWYGVACSRCAPCDVVVVVVVKDDTVCPSRSARAV